MTPLRRLSTAILSCAVLLAAATLSAPARADNPNLTMHRAGATADDGTGWHRAVSTKGSFEVLLPAPFNDFTLDGTDANIGAYAVHTLGCTTDGVKLTVTEMPYTPRMTRASLDALSATWTGNPFQTVSDLERTQAGEEERLSLTVTGTGGQSGFIQYVRTPKALYTLIIEFPNHRKTEVRPIRDQMFPSLKIRSAP